MILIIILVILLIPRYNQNAPGSKNNHGQRSPHRKLPDETNGFELPFPGVWSKRNMAPGEKMGIYYSLKSSFIVFNYKPALPDCGYI